MVCALFFGTHNNIPLGIDIKKTRTPAINVVMFTGFVNGPFRHGVFLLFKFIPA